MRRSDNLARRASPIRTAITPQVLVPAAFMLGRGFPIEAVAGHFKVDERRLRVEIERLNPPRPAPRQEGVTRVLELRVTLSAEEQAALSAAAADHYLYQPACAGLLLRAALGAGRAAVDRLLAQGGRR